MGESQNFVPAKDCRPTKMSKGKKTENERNIICFFLFGILSLIYDEICLIAAEDILAGSKIATTTVILSIAIPVLSVKVIAPWFFQRVSYMNKIALVVVFLIGGLGTLVYSPHIPGRLAGVGVVESGVATSEITFLSLTAFYEHITVSAFVAGVGVASFVGPLYYTSKYRQIIHVFSIKELLESPLFSDWPKVFAAKDDSVYK